MLSDQELGASLTSGGNRLMERCSDAHVMRHHFQSLVVGLPLCLAGRAWSADIVVASAATNGAGSLAAAVQSAAAGDVIRFHSNLDGAEIITPASFNIDKPVTIDGSTLPHGITLSGNNEHRVLMVEGSGPTTPVLRALRFRHGDRLHGAAILATAGRIEDCTFEYNAGGGLQAGYGSVSVSRCVFFNNQSTAGGAILNTDSDLVLNDCIFVQNWALDGHGGAIYSRGFTMANRCQFNGNSAGSGGGLYNRRSLELTNCTFADNYAAYSGGAIVIDHDPLSPVRITNCTISGNEARYLGGGVFHTFSGYSASYAFCTITGNIAMAGGGAGMFVDGRNTSTVSNSIVAGNGGGDVEVAVSQSALPLGSGGRNLIGAGSGVAAFAAVGDQIDVEPLLAPLGNYGGPVPTHALRRGSPAIDAASGAVSVPPTDQRGYSRVVGGGPDSGAYEFGTAAGFPTWQGENLPTGSTTPFGADADANGVPDGIQYVFGANPFDEAASRMAAPPVDFPSDVTLHLWRSTDLTTWEEVLRVERGFQSLRANDLTISGGFIVPGGPSNPREFYRYSAERTP